MKTIRILIRPPGTFRTIAHTIVAGTHDAMIRAARDCLLNTARTLGVSPWALEWEVVV